jgi:hypothetical protein
MKKVRKTKQGSRQYDTLSVKGERERERERERSDAQYLITAMFTGAVHVARATASPFAFFASGADMAAFSGESTRR